MYDVYRLNSLQLYLFSSAGRWVKVTGITNLRSPINADFIRKFPWSHAYDILISKRKQFEKDGYLGTIQKQNDPGPRVVPMRAAV